jgi:endonuclease YncB( thermonuclease family)
MLLGLFVAWVIFWFYDRNKKKKQINALSALSVIEPGPPGSFPIKINRVKDGDTLALDYVQLPWKTGLVAVDLRCAGYDAWEITHKRKSVSVSGSEIEKGKQAKYFLEELVEDTIQAYLKPEQPEFDCYGRLLGYLYLTLRNGTTVDVAETMHLKGHTRN